MAYFTDKDVEDIVFKFLRNNLYEIVDSEFPDTMITPENETEIINKSFQLRNLLAQYVVNRGFNK